MVFAYRCVGSEKLYHRWVRSRLVLGGTVSKSLMRGHCESTSAELEILVCLSLEFELARRGGTWQINSEMCSVSQFLEGHHVP